MNNYEDYEYKPTNREKSKKAVTGYNVCYDCEGQKPGGCKNCDWEKQYARVMKSEGRTKKRDSI